ncbi:MAG: S8 family serine peptidase [Bdellovibrionaceae bacterium]|nr:S8 family serine peptidase [Pseudobdellovibrionaceae bacterium]
MKKLLLLLVAAVGWQTQAAQFDPLLQPFLTRSQDTRIIRVIVTFKDQMNVSRAIAPIRSAQARTQVQQALMQNAKASQAQFIQALGQWTRAGVTNQYYSLWIVNGMILDLPVKDLQRLASQPSVNYVHANSTVSLISPISGRLLAPSQMREEPQYTYGLQKIMIPQLRAAKPDLNGKTVRVAVVDTGIDGGHPDLVNKIAAFGDFVSKQPKPYDDNGHGTHCAGTIGGSATSGTSIGVAPEVRFIGAKFLDKNGSGSFANAILAMQWIADPDGKPETDDGAMISSNSWGGGSSAANQDPKDNALCQAVDSWVKLGIAPIFAAGNSGPSAKSIGLPGGCPNALTVGASDANDQIASFSSRGPAVWKTGSFVKPDIIAPGVKIKSSIPGGKYAEYSGTSMATPHVAGVVSLIYQLQPKISADQLMNVIKTSATKVGSDPNTYGAGRIDALKAAQTLGLRIR